MKNSDARLRFHRLIQSARLPQRADRAAAGTLPTRAYRYCHAVTAAAGYGWWVFPPMDLQLIWDGHDIFWYFDGASDWIPLSPSAQFPDFSRAFDKAAPSSLHGCAPPFLSALPEPGVVQIWTGLMVRTAPEWSVLVRPPANLAAPGGYTLYEGIVETDWWFGPLFTNLRLTRTHKPVHLKADFPLLQVQPLPREAYSEQILNAVDTVPDMSGMTDEDWSTYRATIVTPTENPRRPFGAYAVTARKRRQSENPFSGKPAGAAMSTSVTID